MMPSTKPMRLRSPDDGRPDSIIVGASPLILSRHPSWNRAGLRRLVKDKPRVRISGWLLLEPARAGEVGKTRRTAWGIDPILKIEVWRDERWAAL